MTIRGKFTDQQQEHKSLRDDDAQSPERLVILRMSAVRYLTKVSGFLNIHSDERKRYKEFDPNRFAIPNKDWRAPYPYCPDDVLFPIEDQESENQVSQEFSRSRSVAVLEGEPLAEQLVVNDSLGG